MNIRGMEKVEARLKELSEQKLTRVSHAKKNGKGTHSLIRLEKEEGLAEIHMYCMKNDVKYTNHEVAEIKKANYTKEGKNTVVVWEQIDKHIGRYYEFVVLSDENGAFLEEQFHRELNLE